MNVTLYFKTNNEGITVSSILEESLNNLQLQIGTFTTDIGQRYMLFAVTLPQGYGRSVWIREAESEEIDQVESIQLVNNEILTVNNKFYFTKKVHIDGELLNLTPLINSEDLDLNHSAKKIKDRINDFNSKFMSLIRIPYNLKGDSLHSLFGKSVPVPLSFYAYEAVEINTRRYPARLHLKSYKGSLDNEVMEIELKDYEGSAVFQHKIPNNKEVREMVKIVHLSQSFSDLCERLDKLNLEEASNKF